jgi:hypothetical protein
MVTSFIEKYWLPAFAATPLRRAAFARLASRSSRFDWPRVSEGW